MPETITLNWWQEPNRYSEGVTQSLVQGWQLQQRQQQINQQNRLMALKEEDYRLKREELEDTARGTVEISGVLAEMSRTGGYRDPALRAKFHDAVARNPRFTKSQAYKDAIDSFQAADAQDERFRLESERQDAITERNTASIESRFNLLSDRIGGMMQVEGLRAENRQQLELLKSELNILRDSLKPTRTGMLVHDLTETDLAQMRSDLAALDKMYTSGGIKGVGGRLFSKDPKRSKEQVYQEMRQEILKKYDAKRIGTPQSQRTAPAAESQPVTITSKEQYDQLPSGTKYLAPDGTIRTKQ